MDVQFVEFSYYGVLAIGFFTLAMIALITELTYRKPLIVGLFMTILGALFLASVDLMSRPRPTYLMLPFQVPDVAAAEILAAHFKEDVYIMLLLNWDGVDYPRYYRFPWSQEMAEQIQEGHQEARERGDLTGKLIITRPFDPSLDRRDPDWIMPLPQVDTMPPKSDDGAPEDRLIERNPGDDA